MTPAIAAAFFEKGDHTILMIVIALLVANAITAIRQQSKISQLEHQLRVLFKQQKGTKILSSEAELLAKDPKRKIAAIKLYRDQNPGLSIADAKWDIENLT